MIVLPSARSTASESSLSVTFRAAASFRSVPEALIPFLHQHCHVLGHQDLDSAEFRPTEPVVPIQPYRFEPEFRFGIVAFHVNMSRFVPIRRVEKEPVWPGPQNRWQRIQFTRSKAATVIPIKQWVADWESLDHQLF
jgi:hypothetical protein